MSLKGLQGVLTKTLVDNNERQIISIGHILKEKLDEAISKKEGPLLKTVVDQISATYWKECINRNHIVSDEAVKRFPARLALMYVTVLYVSPLVGLIQISDIDFVFAHHRELLFKILVPIDICNCYFGFHLLFVSPCIIAH